MYISVGGGGGVKRGRGGVKGKQSRRVVLKGRTQG